MPLSITYVTNKRPYLNKLPNSICALLTIKEGNVPDIEISKTMVSQLRETPLLNFFFIRFDVYAKE